MSDLTQRLRAYYPEFWTRTLTEDALIDKLHEIYAMWYASAYAQTVQIQNSYSIKHINSYAYDYYLSVDCTDANAYTPTDPVLYYDYCFKLPYGVFFLESLSYDSNFTDPVVDSRICYDKQTNQFFLAIRNTEFSQRLPLTLFAKSYHSLNVSYPWQHFFTFKPFSYQTKPWVLVPGTYSIYDVPLMYDELEYIKAQYTNMMFAYTQGATYDALDSLFAVTFRKTFSKRDGIVFDFNDNNVWINHGDVVVHYPVASVLKTKFKTIGAPVRQYESLEPSDVELIDWNTNPAKFAQLMIGRQGKLYEWVIGLKPNERENSLVYNDLNLSWDAQGLRYDMGGQLWPDVVGYGIFNGRYYGGGPWLLWCDWRRRKERFYNELDYSCAYQAPTSYWWAPPQTGTIRQRYWKEFFEPFAVNYPEKGEQMVLHRYDYWVDIRYGHKLVYEMLRNVVIWQTPLRSEYHPWIADVLQFYKLAHMKYIPSPMNGVDMKYPHGYGKVYRRHYGGILCKTRRGYGIHHGRNKNAFFLTPFDLVVSHNTSRQLTVMRNDLSLSAQDVNWSVQNGQVDSTGNYTAPLSGNLDTVTVTHKTEPDLTASMHIRLVSA